MFDRFPYHLFLSSGEGFVAKCRHSPAIDPHPAFKSYTRVFALLFLSISFNAALSAFFACFSAFLASLYAGSRLKAISSRILSTNTVNTYKCDLTQQLCNIPVSPFFRFPLLEFDWWKSQFAFWLFPKEYAM